MVTCHRLNFQLPYEINLSPHFTKSFSSIDPSSSASSLKNIIKQIDVIALKKLIHKYRTQTKKIQLSRSRWSKTTRPKWSGWVWTKNENYINEIILNEQRFLRSLRGTEVNRLRTALTFLDRHQSRTCRCRSISTL